MSLQSGVFDQPIVIERKVTVDDGFGGFSEDWITWSGALPGVWARVQPMRGGEALEEGRMNARAMAVFTIWALPGLQESDRIRWNGQVWNIRSLPPSEDVMLQRIEAERGVTS